MDTFVWYQQGINNYLMQNLSASFSAILYNGKYIVFVGYQKLFVLKNRGDDFSFEFYREITLKNNYSHIWQFVGETKILLGDMYYSHKPPTLLAIYDIEKESVEKEIQPYYNHVLWQYFSPLHPVDNRNGQILFSHRAEYAIVVYDTLLQKKDSIYRNIEDWNSLSPKTISYIKKKYNVMSVPCLVVGEGEGVSFGKKNVRQLLEVLTLQFSRFFHNPIVSPCLK